MGISAAAVEPVVPIPEPINFDDYNFYDFGDAGADSAPNMEEEKKGE